MNTTHTSVWLDSRAREPQQPPPVALQKNALLSIARPMGCRIDCIRGCVWITRDGDPEDTILLAGEHLVAEGLPRLIVQALEAGVVRIAGRRLGVEVR